MNHIFYTQNNISHAIILKVIDQLNIRKQDCTIIHSTSVAPLNSHARYICSNSFTVKTNKWLPKSWEAFDNKKKEIKE